MTPAATDHIGDFRPGNRPAERDADVWLQSQHSLTSVADNVSGNIGTTTYAYDAGQRLTTITTSYGGTAGPEIVTSYAPDNQISAQSRTIGGSGTAVNTSYSYDSADRQTTITDYVSGGSALATYIYSYDNANRVTTMVDAEGTYTYTYDNANELTSVYKGGTQVESYAYDANGNRTGTGYSTTVMNETLTSPGVVTYTYDSAGNMISANSGGTITTYTYDYHNRLTGVKQGGTIIATYTYNALDQRIGIQDSGGSTTWTVYNGTNADALPYADFNGSGGALLTRYLDGPGMVNGAVVDELLSRTSSGGTTAWYLTDKLDSVRDVVSSSGSVLDHVIYDSFGNITSETSSSSGDRFKFAGMEYDAVTAQYYDCAREYRAALGRFATQDPIRFYGGDSNLFRYVRDAPTLFTDPTGCETEPDIQPPPMQNDDDRAMLGAAQSARDANNEIQAQSSALSQLEREIDQNLDEQRELGDEYQYYESEFLQYCHAMSDATLREIIDELCTVAEESAQLRSTITLQNQQREALMGSIKQQQAKLDAAMNQLKNQYGRRSPKCISIIGRRSNKF